MAVRTAPGGAPAAVLARRRWLAVAAVAETWRVDEGWWRGTPPAAGSREGGISRLYFEVVLEEGRALTLFQDLLEGGWYAQRAF